MVLLPQEENPSTVIIIFFIAAKIRQKCGEDKLKYLALNAGREVEKVKCLIVYFINIAAKYAASVFNLNIEH